MRLAGQGGWGRVGDRNLGADGRNFDGVANFRGTAGSLTSCVCTALGFHVAMGSGGGRLGLGPAETLSAGAELRLEPAELRLGPAELQSEPAELQSER